MIHENGDRNRTDLYKLFSRIINLSINQTKKLGLKRTSVSYINDKNAIRANNINNHTTFVLLISKKLLIL